MDILQKNDIDSLTLYINNVLEYIENEYRDNILEPKYYIDVLLLSSSAIKFGANRDKWEEIGYQICKYIKQQLENHGTSNNIGMLSGLGYWCYAVNEYSKTTGYLQNFSNSLNKKLYSLLKEKVNLELNKKTNNITVNDYDCISGISGVLHYFLSYLDIIDENIIRAINYLQYLADNHTYKGVDLINFHIKYENQFNVDKVKFPEGHINFGISHGMMGPLIVLAKAYEKNKDLKEIDKTIVKLFNLYEEFKVYKNDIPLWPGQLPLKEYIHKNQQMKYYHPISSWCYGNISIARGMQKTAKIMNWNEKEKLYYNDLIKIINNENYFESPSLCHGFASLLSIRLALYNEKRDILLLENVNRDVAQIINKSNENTKKFRNKKKKIDEEHIEGAIDDLSLLNGSTGIVLVLFKLIGIRSNYENLLMIN